MPEHMLESPWRRAAAGLLTLVVAVAVIAAVIDGSRPAAAAAGGCEPRPYGPDRCGPPTSGGPVVPPADAVRIRPFFCQGNGGQTVPAGARFYLTGGWFTGTYGLLRSTLMADRTTVTETRGGVSTTRSVPFGAAYSSGEGLWRVDWDPVPLFAPLAPGESTQLVVHFLSARSVTDLILPWSSYADDPAVDYDGTGLQYRAHERYDQFVTCTVKAESI